MKEGYTIMKDLKGNGHEMLIIKPPYLKSLINKQIEVSFGDSKCLGIFEGKMNTSYQH